jgi:hypothetical protein
MELLAPFPFRKGERISNADYRILNNEAKPSFLDTILKGKGKCSTP